MQRKKNEEPAPEWATAPDVRSEPERKGEPRRGPKPPSKPPPILTCSRTHTGVYIGTANTGGWCDLCSKRVEPGALVLCCMECAKHSGRTSEPWWACSDCRPDILETAWRRQLETHNMKAKEEEWKKTKKKKKDTERSWSG